MSRPRHALLALALLALLVAAGAQAPKQVAAAAAARPAPAQPAAAAKPAAANVTIVDVMLANGYTRAVQMLRAAGVRRPAPGAALTVFAPSNAAVDAFLKAMGLTMDDMRERPGLAAAVAANHVIPRVRATSNRVRAARPPPSKADPIVGVTAEGHYVLKFYMDPAKPGGVLIEDSQGNVGHVTRADMDAGASVVHGIDRVMLGGDVFLSIADLLRRHPDLESMRVLMAKAGLMEELKDRTVTAFVPTDAAVEAARARLSALTPAELRDVLLYHVLPGERSLPADFTPGQPYGTLFKGHALSLKYEQLKANRTGAAPASGGVRVLVVPETGEAVAVDGAPSGGGFVSLANLYAKRATIHGIEAVLFPRLPGAAAKAGAGAAPAAAPAARGRRRLSQYDVRRSVTGFGASVNSLALTNTASAIRAAVEGVDGTTASDAAWAGNFNARAASARCFNCVTDMQARSDYSAGGANSAFGRRTQLPLTRPIAAAAMMLSATARPGACCPGNGRRSAARPLRCVRSRAGTGSTPSGSTPSGATPRYTPTPTPATATGGGGGAPPSGGAGGSGGSFPNGGPGRGGPWWNDPTYWLGLLLGLGLGLPLINRFLRDRTTAKDRAEGHLESARHHAATAASELGKARKAGAADAKGRAAATAADARGLVAGAADDAKGATKSAAASTKSAAASVKGAVRHAAHEAGEGLEEAASRASGALVSAKHKTVDPVGRAVGSAASGVAHGARDARDALVGKAEDAREAAADAGTDIKRGAKKAGARADAGVEEGKEKSRGWLSRAFGRGKVRRRGAPPRAARRAPRAAARRLRAAQRLRRRAARAHHRCARAGQAAKEDASHAAKKAAISAEASAASAKHEAKGFGARLWGRGEEAADDVSAAGAKAGHKADRPLDGAGRSVSGAASAVGAGLSGAAHNLSEGVQHAADKVSGAAGRAGDALEEESRDHTAGLITAAGVLAATGLLTGVYYATPKETKDRIKRSMRRAGDDAKNSTEQAAASAKGAAASLADSVRSGGQAVADNLRGATDRASREAAADDLRDVDGNVRAGMRDAGNRARDAVGSGADSAAGAGRAVGRKAEGAVGGLERDIDRAADTAKRGIDRTASGGKGAVEAARRTVQQQAQ
ncbi:hypothetical protein HT031_002418 [Scenedesmus sp. PABB004]|nr:hypothetical protein HT031_002418 [Scenedesmus sp. PABB004]